MHMAYIFQKDETAGRRFWFGNFHENLETMNQGNKLWEATGGWQKLN